MSEPTWESLLADEKAKPYFSQLLNKVEQARQTGRIIYPSNSEIFNAFKLTPLAQLKVIILGQDPYHGPGQAHGLCFSVRKGQRPPPSLENIFKELQADLALPKPTHGCLEDWACAGVLLLNSVLTVEAEQPGSHATWGWQEFTDSVISKLNQHCNNLVFMLWGAYAQKKQNLINSDKHFIIASAHPSPLSAHRGFLGSKPFSKCNQLLIQAGKTPINWNIH